MVQTTILFLRNEVSTGCADLRCLPKTKMAVTFPQIPTTPTAKRRIPSSTNWTLGSKSFMTLPTANWPCSLWPFLVHRLKSDWRGCDNDERREKMRVSSLRKNVRALFYSTWFLLYTFAPLPFFIRREMLCRLFYSLRLRRAWIRQVSWEVLSKKDLLLHAVS